jgi:hypothetical protein
VAGFTVFVLVFGGGGSGGVGVTAGQAADS